MTRLLVSTSLALAFAANAAAWDRVGHMTACAIAWEHMSERARERASELLASAPRDSDLWSPYFTEREVFVRAGYWADIVRDESFPHRKETYDRPTWHYVNHFWHEDGTPLPERGLLGDLLTQLEAQDPSKDGVSLAWFLHLAADVHQPLHSSARVTAREPNGDRGGNDFGLDDLTSWNLHAYWDSILRRAYPRHHAESDAAWVARVAVTVVAAHPRATLMAEVDVDDAAAWSKEGAELARMRAYPDDLARESKPSSTYQQSTLEISQRQIALAGYRIAARLNALLE